MDDDQEEVIPPDEELRKRLFSSPSPDKDSQIKGGDEGERTRRKGRGINGAKTRGRRAGFRLSLLAVMLFLMLCALALIVTLHFNDRWEWITWREAQEGALSFFSNKPLNSEEQTTKALFSVLGALPLAVSIGVCTGAFTCLFMYYDSDVPGDFPPTPVSSPRRGVEPSPMESKWHLGYIFVPVNTVVAFSLALVYLRVHIGLGIV